MGEILTSGGGVLDSSRSFISGATGRWAGERLMKALTEGRELAASELRTLDTLRKDEWVFIDEQLVSEAQIRLVGVADLKAAGLQTTVPGSMGKTVYTYEKMTDMQPATVSLDGVTRSEMDRQEYLASGLPLPIIHKDFYFNLRTLTASRAGRGEALDVTQVRTAGRLVAEEEERMLFQGGKTFGGLPIYGYTTHPNRNTTGFGSNGNWAQVAKTGENMLTDVLAMIAIAEADRMFGPYWLYLPRGYSTVIGADFKANSDRSVFDRIRSISGLTSVKVADQMPANTLVLVQATSDVVKWIQGEPLQTIQWDIEGGFHVNFKAFEIAVPLIRADAQGRSGVVHMS